MNSSAKKHSFLIRVAAFAASLSGIISPSLHAADYTYSTSNANGSSGSPTGWSGAIWSPSTPSSNLDNALFFTSPSGQDKFTTNNLGNGFQLNKLSLNNNSSSTNGRTLSISGNSLNFVEDSNGVLPTITFSKATSSAGGSTISAPFTVTNALTITQNASSGATTISGAITNNAGITFNGSGTGSITVGAVNTSGAGSVTISGSYNVNMTGNNSYSGGTNVQSGTLTLGRAAGTLLDSGAVNVSGGTLNVANSDTVGAVTLSGGTISGAGTLTGSSYSLTNAGTVGSALGGSGALTKTGSGTATLSGANTYSGGTTLSAGSLLVNNSTGSGLGSGNVTVDGGKLGGTGAFTGAITVNGGTLSPGASVQSLASGALTMNTGTTFEFEVDSSVATSVGADLLSANGAFSLNGTVDLTLSNIAGSPSAFANGTTFSLISYTGLWNAGTFAGLSDGSTFTFNGQDWTIDYNATIGGLNFTGDQLAGNFVNITAVPEPSACFLFGIGLACLLRRKRSRN